MRTARPFALALFLSLAALRGQAGALPAGLPSQPQAPLTDLAHLVSGDEAQRLNALLDRVWDQGHGPQVAVVTLPDLGGDSIENVSLSIARGWGLGDKARKDGVLLLISQSDRKLRIEVGTKFEGLLTDVACHRIIADVMVPRLRAGDTDAAVDAGVAHILSFVAPGQGPEAPEPEHERSQASRAMLWIILIALWIALPYGLRLLGFSSGRRGGWGGGGLGGGGFGGGSFGGGGGFSGGGGGFSGGGSSGGW